MRGTAAILTCAIAACRPVEGTPAGSPSTSEGVTADVLVEDRFVVEVETRMDVLFVVQNTPGSAPLQAALADGFPAFLDSFLVRSDLDWHLGVVAADIDDPAASGRLLDRAGDRWLDQDTSIPADRFAELATFGERGLATAQPLGAAYLALEVEREGYNAGFLREDAALHVVVVGDGTDATDPARLDPAGFAPWFGGLKADPTDRSLSCLLADDTVGTACGDAAAALGAGVVDALDEAALARVGLVAAGRHHSYRLSRVPVPGSIHVIVEDVSGADLDFREYALDEGSGQLEGDWTWDPVRNDVVFLEYVPNLDSTVVVTYEARPAP